MASVSRNRRVRKIFPVLVLLFCAPLAGGGLHAQSFSVTHAKISLVSQDAMLRPGRANWIGVLFNLDKGWHIYWVNPGDSGAPPHIEWEVPAGFRVGEIHWPVPARLGTGTVIDYGYQGRVLLSMPLEVPASYRAGTPALLKANVRYLICSNICIPAKAEATLTIPSSRNEARTALFEAARQSWPKPMPRNWKARVSESGNQFVLSLKTGMREATATFFPLDEDVIENMASQPVTPRPEGLQMTLKKSDLLTKPVAKLRGVVVLGSDRAFAIAAPVVARSKSGRKSK